MHGNSAQESHIEVHEIGRMVADLDNAVADKLHVEDLEVVPWVVADEEEEYVAMAAQEHWSVQGSNRGLGLTTVRQLPWGWMQAEALPLKVY